MRLIDEDILTGMLDDLQKSQNNLLRTLSNVRIKDKVSIKVLLEQNNMLSINQMHAQVKLTEMWKALNYNNYPLNIEQLQPAENGRSTRGISRGRLAEPATLNTFIGNATRLWNKAPIVIRDSKSISAAKAAIKLFCKTLPV